VTLSRRDLLAGAAAASAVPVSAIGGTVGLPDRQSFAFRGHYVDAAFIHPFGSFAAAATRDYLEARRADPQAVGPAHNARAAAVARFARLINADAADIAVVPSTMDGENLVNLALGTGPGAGVVTDGLHYDASLALYGELHRRGAPVHVVRPRKDGRIELSDVRQSIRDATRLVAISLVSSATGFMHDLAELCAIAHRRGALVYADIIQAAGAVPIDVRATGVDFACAGTYKWLMGDFGTAFLYVRPDRLERLRRVEVGWRQLLAQQGHVLPLEPAGPALGSYTLHTGAAGIFEVSTPGWGPLATVVGSLDYIFAQGLKRMAAHRANLIERIRDGLASTDFIPLTPQASTGPIIAYAVKDADRRFDAALRAANVKISTYRQRIRISPSIYNDAEDIDRLLSVLHRA
jgi:selenocysteine lyase/cysteine desulfurase